MRQPSSEATRSNSQGGQPASWKRGLGTLGGVFLGLVLLVAAWGKVIDPALFAEQIAIEGLDFILSAQAVALIAIGIEVALGTALVLGLRRLWVLLPAGALTAFFLFLTGRHYWNFVQGIVDDSVSCGCFGNLVIRTPAEAFWQDLFLLVPALLLAFMGRAGSGRTQGDQSRVGPTGESPAAADFPSRRVGISAAATLLGLLLAWQAPSLPLDDMATRLRPGSSVAGLCSGRGVERLCINMLMPELEEGQHLVVLADLADPAFGEAVEGLNALALAGTGPTLWVLTDATPDEQYAFFWQWGPVFEIREAPHALLRPLYRRLPRSFIVQGGKVTETMSGLPTESDRQQTKGASSENLDAPTGEAR